MFNRVRSKEVGKVRQIIKRAVSLSRVPGEAQSRGSAAGAYSAMKSPLMETPVDNPEEQPHNGESGVDENGNQFFPFILGVDSPFEDPFAYVPRGYPTRNYGS